jgi:hypothetical protein
MAWYRDYADTLIQRDIHDLACISALEVLPRLLDVTSQDLALSLLDAVFVVNLSFEAVSF